MKGKLYQALLSASNNDIPILKDKKNFTTMKQLLIFF